MEKSELQELAEAVYGIVRLVPRGRATSYGAIARAIGRAGHSRLVGRLMCGCPDDVPAHRVVNSQGILSGSGSFGSPEEMQSLLEAEGVPVNNNRIKGWKTVFWNPMQEL